MAVQKPSLPKGTRDFNPMQMGRRNFIFDTIKESFRLFGFQQLETPTMENLSTLTGKYGDEGDQLIFKILNSGDFLKDVSAEDLASGAGKTLPKVAEKGLRYDLTVPFARYVVMNRNDITLPFKRFQVQPVWRADRPQKGRYREFYQCDADVVGTDSLICELEILLMIKRVFSKLDIKDYSIKINNRKILTGLADVIGEPGRESALCVAIDKLDKIGWEKVKEELAQRDFSKDAIEKLNPIIHLEKSNLDKLDFLKGFLSTSEVGRQGIVELEEVFEFLQSYGEDQSHVDFDVVLARGLSYYTGAIFEVKVNNVSIGSVGGGGRYDNLTGIFGLEGVSGVGFSFGVDRIYDVMEELDIFPQGQLNETKVLITHFDEEGQKYGLTVLKALRDNGISSEIYPELGKIKKQFTYADKKQIPFVIILGADELAGGKVSLKNLETGHQESLSLADALAQIQ
ncbi:histidyl-tRNA synthase [Rhodonellum psychrophilum GCM71 = DSM 17998]|uniref:Histidine--tRNA ligase n=2 Tax=Rhodonellum TaxID=336827 RepID=U5C385_9BACT|nr:MULTISPECIES: histidine--tRNA ligase [Rhodonellum]ERM83361.1 histidyl-tRNA synthase [Rhodonellum psychrophilum GCM71 = DSM 17998]SDZ38359.1 histidyl-tRNA synthetase [Rhodonellum ikkaensis]